MHDSRERRRAAWRMNAGEPDGGGPPLTPLGHPVVSRYDPLAQRIREDLQVHGSNARFPSSAFRLQSLYLDFGRVALAEHLRDAVLRAIEDARDVARVPPQDPGLLKSEGSLFGEFEKEDSARVSQRLARLSRRALMAALVFDAHFWNVRLALEVVAGDGPLESAALRTCAFVAERRTGRSVAGDLRYYAPFRERREDFCSDRCLPSIGPRPSDDRPCLPRRTAADCGMLRILEGFRFFASFPDE
jgi:hypothetical protein